MNTEAVIDSKTFELLYKTHIKAVEAVVRRFRFQDAAADDLVQDIFVKAWTKRENLREIAAFSGWLMQIARNCCLNEYKKQKLTIAISGTDCTGDDESESHIVLAAADESESLELEFSLALVRQAIVHHKHEMRARIAHLFYIEEKSVECIAELLLMKPNTVLSHLHRFRLVVTRAVTALVKYNDLELASTRKKLLRA